MRKAMLLSAVLMMICACAEGFVYTTLSVTGSSSLYDNFYAASQLNGPVPGVAEGIIPQGIAC